MNKTLVRLTKEYVLSHPSRQEEIIGMKTIKKYIDQFNWLYDFLTGDYYELEESNRYYPEWIKVKNYYDTHIKAKARNIKGERYINVNYYKEYDEDRVEVSIGRHLFVVMKKDIIMEGLS